MQSTDDDSPDFDTLGIIIILCSLLFVGDKRAGCFTLNWQLTCMEGPVHSELLTKYKIAVNSYKLSSCQLDFSLIGLVIVMIPFLFHLCSENELWSKE